MINVLFVCLGNICRSPMAEAVFKDLVVKEGLSHHFHIDSVGTSSYHIGDLAHRGTRQVLAAHSIKCDSLSRQITGTDLDRADYIIAMDHSNIADLRGMTRGRSLNGQIALLLQFAGDAPVLDVPDPYYTGNFEKVYRLVELGCQGLLAHVRQEREI